MDSNERLEHLAATAEAVTALTPSLLPQPHSHGNFYISGNARVHLGDNYMHNRDGSEMSLRRKLLTSLSFPQMHERGQQISNAYPDTYKWMLQPVTRGSQQWDCFRSWLDKPRDHHGMYWIHGKPGSGKSTIMKFLHNKLTLEDHMLLWSNEQPVIKVRYFFWKPGNMLQRSVEGLCRHLLIQILEQRPGMLDDALLVQQRTGTSIHTAYWNETELSEALLALVQSLGTSSKFLFLVDGLDECGDSDVVQEKLVDYLTKLSMCDHVKTCISSRPWNLYRDAFTLCPQLRLEDLTRADIQVYVESRLQIHAGWRFFEVTSRQEADGLISYIVDAADGVFLWASLVVRDILRGLRDGDGLGDLRRKLYRIPADLDDYFMCIIESIEPCYQGEASALLQLALHKEKEFTSVFSLRLVDTLLIAERYENFAVRPEFNVYYLNVKDERAIRFLYNSALRKLNSRCKGLLECVGGRMRRSSADIHAETRGIQTPSEYTNWLTGLFETTVEFLHRSLRDFLLLPRTQAILHQFTGGQSVDTRLYLSSARVAQLLALASVGESGDITVGLASHILSALWVNRHSQDSALMALKIRDTVEWLARAPPAPSYWYIEPAFSCWQQEQSNFLSLAIDFQLTSYVLENLTRYSVRSKAGRPILDYILRPRFAHTMCPGARWADPELLVAALACGANPNERYGEPPYGDNRPSIWALHMCFLADCIRDRIGINLLDFETRQSDCFQVLSALIKAGAAPTLPYGWLASRAWCPDPGTLRSGERLRMSGGARFCQRWPTALPPSPNNRGQGHDVFYAVSDLLPDLSPYFDIDLGPVIQDLKSRERQSGGVR
ncbi:hypothetical protein LTR24_000653 [Lithohypha guttulata]|uniref:NACHT domain-containing protein n=1 Tax=Lithohypha guttulata TaxID=1690604 RepID=A0ABR0KNH7_9EURO|nr:hypothetical protein LTR24_000653 [Lithohypha guttulata]